MTEQLLKQIWVVARARQRAQVAYEAKNVAKAEWEERNKALLDEATIAAQETSEEEALLRELTLQAYRETGNKAPAIGVGIREVTKLEYDIKVAFNWAVEHTMALKLDTPAFEKIAKVSPPNFVKIFQEPQATIAAQLEVEK